MSRNGKGDAFTKLLRRRILKLFKEAREADRLDKQEVASNGSSDYYYESQRAWSRLREAESILLEYCEWKQFK